MYKDSKRTCTVIVLLIKPFVWWRSRCRGCGGLFKFSVVVQRTAKKFTKIYNARAQPLLFSLNLLFGDMYCVISIVCACRPQKYVVYLLHIITRHSFTFLCVSPSQREATINNMSHCISTSMRSFSSVLVLAFKRIPTRYSPIKLKYTVKKQLVTKGRVDL